MLGQAVGGAGALYLVKYIGFSNTYFFVAAAILAVTLLVVLPLQEPVMARVAAAGAGLQRMGAEVRLFVRQVWGAFTESRASLVGLGVCGAAGRRDGAGPVAVSRRWPWTWASMTIRSHR